MKIITIFENSNILGQQTDEQSPDRGVLPLVSLRQIMNIKHLELISGAGLTS